MIARIVFCSAFAALTAVSVAARGAPPEAIKASYDVFKGGLRIGVAEESFEKSGARYSIISETTPSGVLALLMRTRVKLQSSGVITSAGLQPEQFDYVRLDDASRNVSATFDWRAGQLRMAFEGRKETAPLPQGTQDRLSLMYQFMFLPLDKLKLIPVQMTNGRKIESYRYRVGDEVPLETPLGRIKTLHLVKQREADDKNQIEVWLATERNFVPVKLLIVESDGSRFEQVVTRLEFK